MRYLLIIVFAVVFFNILSAQTPTNKPVSKKANSSQRPSNAEINAQMEQVKREATERIASMEKEIAEAKANKEDPETIKQKEDLLATLKQITGSMENAVKTSSNPRKTLPPSKTVEPKYVSPFVPIVLKQPASAPKEGQAKDHLLWYKGKKIDASTLITTNSTVVRYNRQRNVLIVQPESRIDSPGYYGLVNTLAQMPRVRNEFAFQMNGIMNSFFMFPLIEQAYDEFSFFRERYYDMAKNTIDLNYNSPNTNNSPNINNNLSQAIEDLLAYIASLQSPRNIQLPPTRPSDLCVCNARDRKNYENEIKSWSNYFWSEEEGIIHRLKGIYMYLDLLERLHQSALYPIPNFQEEMANAFNAVIERSMIKIEELAKKYETPDIYMEESLVLALKYLQKQLIVVGNAIGSAGQTQSTRNLKREVYGQFERLKGLIIGDVVFGKFIEEQMRLKNYNAVFDKSLYMGHEINKNVLDRSYKINENYMDAWEEKLKKFNRFTLSISMNFMYELFDPKTNELGMTADGMLESDKITVSLQRIDCGWSLYVTDVDHLDRNSDDQKFHIPINVLSGTKIFYTKPKKTLSYAGPKKMYMIFPVTAFSFCPGSGYREFFSMDLLRYSDIDLKTHAQELQSGAYSLDMNQYANKMFMSVMNTKFHLGEVMTMAEIMRNMESQVQLPQSSGSPAMDEMKMEWLSNKKRVELLEGRKPLTNTANNVIPFDAQNGKAIIIDKTHDTVDPNDPDKQVGIRMTRGLVTVKVEHTPQ